MITDEERQQDEMFALQSIYNPSEFKYIRNHNIECSFSIAINLTRDNLSIEFDGNVKKTKLYVKHLPPIRFYARLPEDYPSTNAPEYFISINWLTPWKVSLVCQKLDVLWQENRYKEILFIWLEFLKNDLPTYLDIKDTLDVSFFIHLFERPTNPYFLQVFKWTDNRAIYAGLNLNPIEKLLDHDNVQELLRFETNFQECGICFIVILGRECKKLNHCNHTFCNNCIAEFLRIKINEQNVNDIRCPAFDCKINIKFNQIEEICTPALFQFYKKQLLQSKLKVKRSLVYCPRKICQNFVFVKEGENLAFCTNCEYNFCCYCFKVYHGVSACNMDSEEKFQLIQEYKNGDVKVKMFLEKKYGRHQIRQIVERKLTNDYLKENTKACPSCKSSITKASGCNLMKCLHCHINFCWLCNLKIITEDPYDHFKFKMKGSCVGRLFEGIIDN